MTENPSSSLLPVETSDSDLIQETLRENPKSYDRLVQRHQAAIFRMVYRNLRQREEAEDVVQQVFLQAYRNLGKFRGEAKFFTWLYTIAFNLIRNHIRKRNLRRMYSIDAPGKTEDGPSPQWKDNSPSPEEVVHHRSELERVVAALANLGEPHRSIFTLHYFKHLSLKEVSIRTGRPVGTVKVYLHRARKIILGRLESKGDAGDVTS